MILLNLSNIKKAFGTELLFENVSFNIEDKDKIGLVGVNGCGKTTLFKMITGEIHCDAGDIFKSKSTNMGYMQQHIEADWGATVWDEIMKVYSEVISTEAALLDVAHQIEKNPKNDLLHIQHDLTEKFENMGGYTYKSIAKSSLMGLGFSEAEFNLPFNKLSGGQKTRVLLCKILLGNSNLLLLDEPTNHLDISSTAWLEEFLKNYKGSVLIISHDRYFLDKVTNKTFEMENKKLTVYNGNYSSYVFQKEEKQKAVIRQYENTTSEIARLEGIIKQQKQWNREKNIKTAESKQKVIDRLEKNLEKPQTAPENIKFKFNIKPSGTNDVLICDSLKMSFGGKQIFENASLQINKGERVFLLGPNGCGKTTLFKIISNQLKEISGSFKMGTSIKMGYYDQAQANLDYSKSAIDEVWDSFPKMSQTNIRNALAVFLFKGDDVFKEISNLSGGEKARIALLKLMLSEANFLLLDEPTNHLDIWSKEALESALLSYDGTLFIISHDRYFINKLATKICYLSPDKLEIYNGNYDYFIDKRKPTEIKAENNTEKKADYKIKKENDALKRKLENKLKKLEQEIFETENSIAEKNAMLLKDEYATNFELAMQVSNEIEKLSQALENLYDEWSELSYSN